MKRWLMYLICLALLPLSLLAHPHFFVTAEMQIEALPDKQVKLSFRWLFDAMTSQNFIQQYDFNQNQAIDPEEEEAIRESAFETLRSYDYFHPIRISGEIPLSITVEHFHAFVNDESRLVFEFSAVDPVGLPDGSFFTIGCFDPESFVYMQMEKEGVTILNQTGRSISYQLMENASAVYYGYTVRVEQH